MIHPLCVLNFLCYKWFVSFHIGILCCYRTVDSSWRKKRRSYLSELHFETRLSSHFETRIFWNSTGWMSRLSHDTCQLDYVQTSKRFFFCLQQQTVPSLNDDHLTNGHMSAIFSNTALIAHARGDIGYFCIMKKTTGPADFVRCSKCLDLSLGSVWQTFTIIGHAVEPMEVNI